MNVRPFLQSKLTSPVKGPSFVQRSRLDDLFCRADFAKLILIQAPAGYGKTTAMIQWKAQLNELGKNTAWLSLDESDNDPGRFLTYLMAAMQTADPSLDLEDLSIGYLEKNDFEDERLLNFLARLPVSQAEFTLFIDEFETIFNVEINNVLRQVLKHLPAGRRLVITTRTLPELGLARMRAQGELVMIDVDDLRFDLADAKCFLCDKRNLDLDESILAQMHQKVEGWATGLQLASLSLSGQRDSQAFVRAVSGSFTDIADYLAEDVFAKLPETVRNFLLKTSILNRLSPSLCDEVAGLANSRGMLQQLERDNLFLLPLDDKRNWYRYHKIFSEFLQGMLAEDVECNKLELHRKAAHWFSREGNHEEAVRHALAAGDQELAVEMMGQCVTALFRHGQMQTIVDWIEPLPPEVLGRHSKLKLAYGWALAFLNRHPDAIRFLDELADNADGESSAQVDSDDILALRFACMLCLEQFDEIEQEAKGDPLSFTRQGTWPHGSIGNVLAYSHFLEHRFSQARDMARMAQQSHQQVKSLFGQTCSRWIEILVRLAQGHLLEALSLSRSSLSMVREVFSGISRSSGMLACTLGLILYEMNELEEADRLLQEHREVFKLSMPLDIIVLGFIALARISFARGDFNLASRQLWEAEEITRGLKSQRLTLALQREKIKFALRRGDKLHAEQLYNEIEKSNFYPKDSTRTFPIDEPETATIHRLRVMIRLKDAAEALPLLAEALMEAEKAGYLQQVLILRILKAEALDTCGDREEALQVLAQALAFAAPQGFIRAFVDEGATIVALVRELRKDTGVEGDFFNAYLDSILEAAGERLTVTQEAVSQPQAEIAPLELDLSIEPLTAREAEVLILAAKGFSNVEVAEALFVSVSTVKFHLHNINSKLGTKNRTQAILFARNYGMIPG